MRYSIGPKFLARILLETNHFDNQGRVALECLLCSYRESLSGYQYHTSSKHTRLQLDGQNANQMSQIGSIQSDSELQSIRSRVGPKCGNEICSRSVRPSTYPSDRPAASVSPSSHGTQRTLARTPEPRRRSQKMPAFNTFTTRQHPLSLLQHN